MQYFKTFGDALAHQFAQDGQKDDKGNPIVSTEQPMTKEEYQEFKAKQLQEKIEAATTNISKIA